MPDDLPVIHGDRNLIEWTVGNLIYYTLKHSPRPGTVTVRAQKRGEGVLLSVSNPALRLPSEACDHLFDKFSRKNKNSRVGSSGVGLYLCKLVAQAHHGQVSVACDPGSGHAFKLWLPLSPSNTDDGLGKPSSP